jgi:hypothetical protein
MGASAVLFEQLKDNRPAPSMLRIQPRREVFMFPIIGPEMVAALLRPADESDEPMEEVKPRSRPQSTSNAVVSDRRRLLKGNRAASHWIRFKVILFAFCRRVSSV